MSGLMPANPAARLRELLTGDDVYGTTLLVWCEDTFGQEHPDWKDWHPLTLQLEIKERLGVQLPSANFSRLMAAICVLTTDYFFKSLPRFIQLANILAGDDIAPGVYDPADAVECAWAVTEALLLSPPDEDDHNPFADDIRRYIGAVLRDEGFTSAPDVLGIALDGPPAGQSDQPQCQEVKELIRDGLRELKEQIVSLPLQHGTTTELESKLGISGDTKSEVKT